MSFSASCNPGFGVQPSSAGFDIEVTGNTGEPTCIAAPPPAPNPDPFPAHTISWNDTENKFEVLITGSVDPDTVLTFKVEEGNDVAAAQYHANP